MNAIKSVPAAAVPAAAVPAAAAAVPVPAAAAAVPAAVSVESTLAAMSAIVILPSKAQIKAQGIVSECLAHENLVGALTSTSAVVRTTALQAGRIAGYNKAMTKSLESLPANFSGVANWLNAQLFAVKGDPHFIGAKQSDVLSAGATLALWVESAKSDKTKEMRASKVSSIDFALDSIDKVRTLSDNGKLKLK